MILWFVYLLVNEKGRTYIGATTNYERRLRQHNREIKGGARSTKGGGPWLMLCHLAGFRTKSEAYRWEKLLKMRARGHRDRLDAFHLVGAGRCPSYKKRPQYPVPPSIRIYMMQEGK